MSKKMYKFEDKEFEVVETGCMLEARLKGEAVYGSVVPSGNYDFPFVGKLLDANGQHISSQLAKSVAEALRIACGYVLSYQEPNGKKACEDIQKFYDDLSE